MNNQLIPQIHEANQLQRNGEQQGAIHIVPIRRGENIEREREGEENEINID